MVTLTRRRLLAGTAGLLVAGALHNLLPLSQAFAAPPLASAVNMPEHFLALSTQLTGIEQPDALLSQRLYSWLYQQFPQLDQQIDRLSTLLNQQQESEAAALLSLLASQPQPLRELYQALVSGWYLGVVGESKPQCIAFENIVSYALVRDSLTPPSYAPGEPNFWTQPPHKETGKNV